MNLISLYFWIGDLKHVAITAREFRNLEEVSTEQLLQVVRFILHEDQRLAADLWRKAFQQGIPDMLVGDAFFMGSQVDLDTTEEMRLLSHSLGPATFML